MTQIIRKPICVPVQSPQTHSNYIRLNYLNSWDDDFIPIKCKTSDCGQKDCDGNTNKIYYISTDPRLISSAHNGDKLALDTVPRNGKVQFNTSSVYPGPTPANIPSYKPVYNSYSDIRGGDISYYFGQDLANPFIPQLFIQNKQTFQPGPIQKPPIIKEHYIDPMDSYKPHYCREPVYTENCLSWIKDSQYHREDLMSKQLWNRNQSNFEVDIVTN